MAFITPSFINVYMLCPAKARFHYIEKQPAPPAAPLVIGRAFDRATMEYYSARIAGRRMPDLKEVYVETLRQNTEGVEFSKEDTQKLNDSVDTGCRALVEYVETVGPSVVPAGVQVRREMEYTGGKVVGYADVIGGTRKSIAVTRLPVLVADVKTMSRPPQTFRTSDLVQLVSYSTRRCSPSIEIDYPGIQLHWVMLGKFPKVGVISKRLNQRDVAFVEGLARHVSAAVRAGSFPPNRDAYICTRRHCPFWQQCEQEYGGTVKP